jgi:hypothetical protein
MSDAETAEARARDTTAKGRRRAEMNLCVLEGGPL